MRGKMRQYILSQLLDNFRRRSLRKLNTQSGVIHTHCLPFLQQGDQPLAPGTQCKTALLQIVGGDKLIIPFC